MCFPFFVEGLVDGPFLLMRRKALEALQEASVGERFELSYEQKLKVFQEEFSSSKASCIS